MIKSYLQAQKRFFVWGLLLLIGVPHFNQVSIANPRKVKFFATHQPPPETPLISSEKNEITQDLPIPIENKNLIPIEDVFKIKARDPISV